MLSIIIFAVVLGSTTLLPAQTSRPTTRLGAIDIYDQIKSAVDQLHPSDSEKARLEGIWTRERENAGKLQTEAGKLNRPDLADAKAALVLELRDQLSQVLLPEEVQKLSKLVHELVYEVADDGTLTLDLFSGALAKLDLSADQKPQIDSVLKDAQRDTANLKIHAASGQDITEQVSEFRQHLRFEVAAILNLDQLEALRKLMQAPGGEDAMTESPEARPHVVIPVPSTESSNAKPSEGAQVGKMLPDFSVVELNGLQVTPANFKGKVLVIEFGSYTSPEFRAHVAAMEDLKTKFFNKVTFLIVYTKEAYPVGPDEIDRNIAAGISIPAHENINQRRDAALKARSALHITIPIALDPIENTMSQAYGGFPNGTVVADKDGYVTARQRWNTIDGLRVAIQDAVNQ